MQRARGSRTPGGGSDPPTTIGGRAAEVIERQRVEMRRHLGAALAGRDPEGVHDMRVASRRLRACLRLLAPWIDSRELARVERAVRSVTRALGSVREVDVLRLRLASFSRRAQPARALALEALDSRLERRRRQARVAMMRRFAKVDLDKLDHRLRRIVAHLETSAQAETPGDRSHAAIVGAGISADVRHPRDRVRMDAAGAPGSASADSGGSTTASTTAMAPLSEAETAAPPASAPTPELLRVTAPAIRGAARDALGQAIPDAIGSPEASEAIHRVRIAAKKLRYQLEIVEPELGASGKTLLRRLKHLQDAIGDFHDDTVFDEALVKRMEDASEHGETRLARELRRFRTLRRRALLRDEASVRAAITELRESGFEREIDEALARSHA